MMIMKTPEDCYCDDDDDDDDDDDENPRRLSVFCGSIIGACIMPQ